MEETRQWQRVKDIFDSALELETALRNGFLDRECGTDAFLRSEVESLLLAHEHSGDLSVSPFAVAAPPEPQESDVIGPYRLIRKIGEGGMGQVWLAEQTEPLSRQVALKLIRPGIFDDSHLERFQMERQSLAVMEHPSIAKVFDAGTTDAGQPYLVMEYVPGEPVTKYCDRKKLAIDARLELFAKVCEGVQHAHQKAILHLDLKPANILVVEVDGQPQPRIIDFGLARAVKAGAEEGGDEARHEILAGTPGYMSPEQLGAGDVDTRTDVYSLGVVLYELLCGQSAFGADRRIGAPIANGAPSAERAPIAPSRRVTDRSEASIDAAGNRGTSPDKLARKLAGDLDLITAKALARERARRYGGPSQLADDLRRYLGHRPVEAHPPGKGYYAGKYLRRHRVGVAIAAGLVALLVVFASLQAIALRRIARERDRAARITDFMIGIFKISDPGEARGNQVTAREILDKASSQIESGLNRDPEAQSQMMMTMGAVYENLGLYEKSESMYRQAVAIREQQLGPEKEETLQAKASLAWVLYRRGHYRDAEKRLRDLLAIRQRQSGTNNAATISVMDSLGAVLNEEGHSVEAEGLERQALAFRRRTLGDENTATLTAMNHLALTLQNQGRWKEAEDLDRQQIPMWRRIEGDDSPRGLYAADNLGINLYREGRLAEAEALVRETLDTKRRVLGADHPETIRSLNTLTAILTDEGKLAEAQTDAEEVVSIRTRVLGAEHPLTLSAMSNLSEIVMRRGDFVRADDLLTRARGISIRVQGLDNPGTALITYNLACLELRRGKPDDALRLLREAIDHGLASWVVAGMGKDPDLAGLRSDPRFEAMLGKTGVAGKSGTPSKTTAPTK